MIDSLKHLPRSVGSTDALAEQFTDLAPPLTARQAAIEAARCLYCYDAPCTRICPSEIDVASFIRNIHDHNINGAAHGILKQNILGGSCARVCPTEILCEDACVRNHDEEGQPVKIGLLQRHALDHASFAAHPFQRAPLTGKHIAIVGFDSSPAVGAYDVFVNQVDFSGVGVNLADWACELAPGCTGEIAILSAAATATNQNEWIELMKTTLKEDKYKGLKLVDTVYGDDDATKSTTQAQGLLTKYPNLKVIVAPTTVGILAAAQVVSQAKKSDSVKVSGLGFPNDMKPFVKDGTSPVFGLWSVPDLGYLSYVIADKLVKGEITGKEGETFTVKGLNGDKPYTIGKDSVVILGPAFRFDSTNVENFDF